MIPRLTLARSSSNLNLAAGIAEAHARWNSCGDGKLTVALGDRDGYLVHGLDSDKQNVAAARRFIKSRGLYGKVSAMHLMHQRLPYADSLVNLVVSDNLNGVPVKEVMRVLCPGGVAYLKMDGKWTGEHEHGDHRSVGVDLDLILMSFLIKSDRPDHRVDSSRRSRQPFYYSRTGKRAC